MTATDSRVSPEALLRADARAGSPAGPQSWVWWRPGMCPHWPLLFSFLSFLPLGRRVWSSCLFSHTFILLGPVGPKPCYREACARPPYTLAGQSGSLRGPLPPPTCWTPHSLCRVVARVPVPFQAFRAAPLLFLKQLPSRHDQPSKENNRPF